MDTWRSFAWSFQKIILFYLIQAPDSYSYSVPVVSLRPVSPKVLPLSGERVKAFWRKVSLYMWVFCSCRKWWHNEICDNRMSVWHENREKRWEQIIQGDLEKPEVLAHRDYVHLYSPSELKHSPFIWKSDLHIWQDYFFFTTFIMFIIFCSVVRLIYYDINYNPYIYTPSWWLDLQQLHGNL